MRAASTRGRVHCPAGQAGVDPVGNNTWYYVHTLAVFYIDDVLIHGSEGDDCNNPPGTPLVPTTDTGAGFLGCIKGWFVNYVTAGPIIPGQNTAPGTTAIGSSSSSNPHPPGDLKSRVLGDAALLIRRALRSLRRARRQDPDRTISPPPLTRPGYAPSHRFKGP